MSRPLDGIRVLDFSQVEAGPTATSFLSDLGAQVIRVESTQYWQFLTRGTFARPTKLYLSQQVQKGGYPQGEPGDRPWERWGQFHAFNRGKLSMTVDLTRPEGREVFLKLARISDVIIEGNTPGTAEKLGVDYHSVAAVNPRIIYVSVSGYGSTGPYGGQRTLGPLLQTFVGHDLLRGYPDSDPTTNTVTVTPDPAAGAAAALGTFLALLHRRRTGRGQYVETAIIENFLPFLGWAFMDCVLNGRVNRTLGNRHTSAIQGCYPCRGQDRWAVITIQDDAQWQGLLRAMGDPSWSRDERFADVLSRYRNQDALDEHISAWTRQHDPHDVMHLLQEQGIPAGVVLNQADAYADPHLKERGYFQPITHQEVGPYLSPGPPWRFSACPLTIPRPAPCLGEHNEYIYKELLGFTQGEYLRFQEEGHIGSEPPP